MNFFHSAAELSDWAKSKLPIFTAQFVGRHARLAALQVPYVVAIAPEKQSVYPEYLPSGHQIVRPTMAELLTAACANAGLEAIDLTTLLISAKGVLELYLQEDSHWNQFGAYVAYCAIMEAVQKKFPVRMIEPTAVRYQEKQGYSDLGVLMTPERRGRLQEVNVAGTVTSVLEAYDQREYSFTIHSSEQGRGRAIVLRDSFAAALAPYLSRTFAETIYITRTPMMDDLIEEMKPDVVIHECAERALCVDPKTSSDLEPRSWRQLYLEAHEHPRYAHMIRPLRLALRHRRFDDAVGLGRQLSKASEGELNHNLVEAMIGSGAYQEAVDLCLQIEANRGRDSFLSYLKGWAHSALGRNGAALASMRAALDGRPGNACFLYLYGSWVLEHGDVSAAAHALQRAVDRVPDSVEAWRNLSRALFLQGDTAGAMNAHSYADRLDGILPIAAYETASCDGMS
jgi:alginate O-acetyltransferase complex protein AlgJ